MENGILKVRKFFYVLKYVQCCFTKEINKLFPIFTMKNIRLNLLQRTLNINIKENIKILRVAR